MTTEIAHGLVRHGKYRQSPHKKYRRFAVEKESTIHLLRALFAKGPFGRRPRVVPPRVAAVRTAACLGQSRQRKAVAAAVSTKAISGRYRWTSCLGGPYPCGSRHHA